MLPLVSVVVPTFNGAAYLREALDSIFAQTSRNFEMEVIVVDDQSTDDTPTIVRTYGNRIQFLTVAHTGQPGATRNVGIRAATGQFVAFLDSDDICLPGRIQRQADLIESTGADLVGCNCFEFLEGSPVRVGFFEKIGAKPRLEAAARASVLAEPFNLMLEIGGFMPPSCVMARKEALFRSGLFSEHLKCAQDLKLFLLMALRGSIAVDFTPLVLRRIHESNLSRDEGICISNCLSICEELQKLDEITRDSVRMGLLRTAQAKWYRMEGALFMGQGKSKLARQSWAHSFKAVPSVRLASYWALTFLPSFCLRALWALNAATSDDIRRPAPAAGAVPSGR
jgi:glycosyltransferase involved in cell wall biosynthesis